MNTKGKNISEARKNAGLTMEGLGKMVGVSPKTVQERLGHEKIETTFNRYVHNTGKMQNDAVEIFDNILKSAIM